MEKAISNTIDVTKSLNEITSSNLAFAKEALQLAANAGDAITPFVPLIGAASTIITGIIDIYQTSQYNRKICNSVLDRARLAEMAIDQLIRRRKDNEENFNNRTWYNAFDRFVRVLGKLKAFAEKISQLKGIASLLRAKGIKERFETLAIEYDDVMKDLNFTMAIANERQRQIDHESVKDDLSEITEFLEKIDDGFEESNAKIALISEEVRNIKLMIAKSEIVEVKYIDNNKLCEPEVGKKNDTRAAIKRKIYMGGVEVACRPIKIPGKDTNEYITTQRHLAIYMKATQSPNIIQFYGLSEIDGSKVMVLEWAELGNLKELYEVETIPLKLKLSYALDICRGIAYLNALDIYHHDLRCQNVVVTSKHVAKLTNFEFSREKAGETTLINSRIVECGRWLSPEKLKDDKYRYDHKCEIFGFGMLLWELIFERKPYKDKDIGEVAQFVIDGHREKIEFSNLSPDEADIQKGFEHIIKEAWAQDPDIRISISKLLIELDTLSKLFVKPGRSPGLQPQKVPDVSTSLELNNQDNHENEIPEYDCIDLDSVEFKPIIPMSDGIKAHRAKDYKNAWKCFEEQAENQNSLGKYWKAYYLWEGFLGQKDKMTALTLYKEAADDNFVDAQYRYAVALLDKDLKSIHKVDAIKYLQLAAENGSAPAQYQIGEAYFKGKLGYQQSLKMAKIWYKRAALQNDKNAVGKLKSLNSDD